MPKKNPNLIVSQKSIPAGYSEKEIQSLLADATRQFPAATHIAHILPRAYCLAKPAPRCAVFAIPTPDREPQVQNEPVALIQSRSAENCEPGKWYRLAYICQNHDNRMEVILPTRKRPPATAIEEQDLKQLSHRGTVRICVRALGKGFQIKGYTNGDPNPKPFDLRGDHLGELVEKALQLQLQKSAQKNRRGPKTR